MKALCMLGKHSATKLQPHPEPEVHPLPLFTLVGWLANWFEIDVHSLGQAGLELTVKSQPLSDSRAQSSCVGIRGGYGHVSPHLACPLTFHTCSYPPLSVMLKREQSCYRTTVLMVILTLLSQHGQSFRAVNSAGILNSDVICAMLC